VLAPCEGVQCNAALLAHRGCTHGRRAGIRHSLLQQLRRFECRLRQAQGCLCLCHGGQCGTRMWPAYLGAPKYPKYPCLGP
jgi:hypothetical protein